MRIAPQFLKLVSTSLLLIFATAVSSTADITDSIVEIPMDPSDRAIGVRQGRDFGRNTHSLFISAGLMDIVGINYELVMKHGAVGINPGVVSYLLTRIFSCSVSFSLRTVQWDKSTGSLRNSITVIPGLMLASKDLSRLAGIGAYYSVRDELTYNNGWFLFKAGLGVGILAFGSVPDPDFQESQGAGGMTLFPSVVIGVGYAIR